MSFVDHVEGKPLDPAELYKQALIQYNRGMYIQDMRGTPGPFFTHAAGLAAQAFELFPESSPEKKVRAGVLAVFAFHRGAQPDKAGLLAHRILTDSPLQGQRGELRGISQLAPSIADRQRTGIVDRIRELTGTGDIDTFGRKARLLAVSAHYLRQWQDLPETALLTETKMRDSVAMRLTAQDAKKGEMTISIFGYPVRIPISLPQIYTIEFKPRPANGFFSSDQISWSYRLDFSDPHKSTLTSTLSEYRVRKDTRSATLCEVSGNLTAEDLRILKNRRDLTMAELSGIRRLVDTAEPWILPPM